MNHAIDGASKRPNYSSRLAASRSSDSGLPMPGRYFWKLSPEALAGFKKRVALRKKATMQAVSKEILAFYRPGWPELLPAQKRSRAAIAQALLRQGSVTAVKDPGVLTKVLESLARAGKIKLPPKNKKGSARQKKK